jgi:Zn-dependent M16 (insulinase) family peptidase
MHRSENNLNLEDPLEPEREKLSPDISLNITAIENSPIRQKVWREIRREFIQELNGEAILFRHPSGVEVLVISNQDVHRYFGISFKTAPVSNCGEPHVAEHMIYRGSERYPSQEPITAYLKSSLYTDSNAYTAHDYTVFYHSSPDDSDFINQIHLTSDAVFKPLLREDSFREEAWRFDFDKDGQPYLNGIVLNEMKGAASDPEQVHEAIMNSELLKDTPFVFNAGGVSELIPQLSLEDLKKWMQQNYTPERCRIFIYGLGDTETWLSAIADHIPDDLSNDLSESNSIGRDAVSSIAQEVAEVPVQMKSEIQATWLNKVNDEYTPREFNRIKRVVHQYPGGETEDASRDSIVTLSWRLKSYVSEPIKEVAVQILFNTILCGNDNSPLVSALNESGLGEDIFGGEIGFDTPYPIFTIGLSGTAAHRAEEIESIIEQAIYEVVRDGIADDLIDRGLTAVEYQEREAINSATRGADLVDTAVLAMIRGGDPIRSLRPISNVAEIRKLWGENPHIFVEIIKEELITNKNRLTLTLRPNRDLVQKAEDAQKELAGLIYEDKKIKYQDLMLVNPGERDTLKDQISIPKLKVSEIVLPKPAILEVARGDNLLIHEAPTCGVGFVDVTFSLRGLDLSEVPDAALLSELFVNLDTSKITWKNAVQRFNHRSNIDCHLDVAHNHRTGGVDARIVVSIAAEAGILPEILEGVFALPGGLHLDNRKRVISLFRQSQANYEGEIYSEGMKYALRRAEAHLDLSSYVRDLTDGIGYIRALRSTVKEARSKWTPVLERLQGVLSKITTTSDIKAQITADSFTLREVLPKLEGLCREVRTESVIEKPVWRVPKLPSNEGFIIPTTVSFVGQSFDVCDHKSVKSVDVVANHLRNAFLWDNVRRSGGAYSTDLNWNIDTRIMSIGSGRDPAPLKSIKIFEEIPQWLRSRYFGIEELKRSIITPLGQLIAPKSVSDLGTNALLDSIRERPKSYREDLFERIKSTSTEDVESFAGALERAKERGAPVVIVGSRKSMRQLKDHYGENLVSVELLE